VLGEHHNQPRGASRQTTALARDLVRAGLSWLIATTGISSTIAAKARQLRLVFVRQRDPVRFGLLTVSVDQGGNVTGINLMSVDAQFTKAAPR